MQRQIDKLLRLYKEFARVYVNNIIIFSRILYKYLNYLFTIFQLFRNKRVNLLSIKFYLDYLFIILLDQQVDSLDMFTSTKKIATIILLRFFYTLRNLEFFLDLQDIFVLSIFLIHYNKLQQLYIDLDIFKQFDLVAIVYYVLEDF